MLILEKDAERICTFLLSLPLFLDADRDILLDRVANGGCELLKFDRSQVIYSPSQTEKRLLFVLEGSAAVYSVDESRSVLLRTLEVGDTVGVANIFTDKNFVSRIIATAKTKVLTMRASDLSFLLERDRGIMYNYISFLSDRICYLNKKIVCLTAGSAERKFAFFLDSLGSGGSVTLPLPMNAIADMLSIGRASLYRASERLTNDGFIIRHGKKITLLDRDAMLDYYK